MGSNALKATILDRGHAKEASRGAESHFAAQAAPGGSWRLLAAPGGSWRLAKNFTIFAKSFAYTKLMIWCVLSFPRRRCKSPLSVQSGFSMHSLGEAFPP